MFRFLQVTCILFFLGVYVYHLRCYIYQARNLMALDKDSFSGKRRKNSVSHVITQQASLILLFLKWML